MSSLIDYSKWDKLDCLEDEKDYNHDYTTSLNERDIVAQNASTIASCRADAKKVFFWMIKDCALWTYEL